MKLIGAYLDEKQEVSIFQNYHCNYVNLNGNCKCKKKWDLILIDSRTEGLEEKLNRYFQMKIPSILLVGPTELSIMKKYLLNGIVVDCVPRNTISMIQNSIKLQLSPKEEVDTLFLKDSSQVGMLKINMIESITYCSVQRVCRFNLENGKTFILKRKFSDIEKIQQKEEFVKIERGTIVNTCLIESLNYKEECICFKSGNVIYISRRKLKDMEKMLFSKCCGLYLWKRRVYEDSSFFICISK